MNYFDKANGYEAEDEFEGASEAYTEKWKLIEELGDEAKAICCRHQIASETYGIPLEFQTYAALNVLVEGGTLADAIACVNLEHPFAKKVVAELGVVAQKLADDHYKARLRFLS